MVGMKVRVEGEGDDERCHFNAVAAAQPHKSVQECLKVYESWAPVYEEDFSPTRYRAPQIAAEALAECFPEERRKGVVILDVAAGTGLVGEWLRDFGFKNLDAVDPCESMLDILKSKNIYNRIVQDFIGDHMLDIQNDTYDGVIIAGGFVEGHVPISAVDEMLRIVRPGGYVVICMRLEYLTNVQEYKNLEPLMKSLEKKGVWKQILRNVAPNYFYDKQGILFVYQKQ